MTLLLLQMLVTVADHEAPMLILTQVLHATPKLRDSLVNVHELLAPNGRLILHELHPGRSISV